MMSENNREEQPWLKQQQRVIFTQDSPSTLEQAAAEDECAPFMVDLPLVPQSQLAHMRELGLLRLPQPLNDDNDTHEGNDDDDPFAIWLLRDKHEAYLKSIWNMDAPLKSSFVNLDASRTWMIYWCLHGADLLGRWKTNTPSSSNNNSNPNSRNEQPDDAAATTLRTVQTLQRCFTKCHVTLPRSLVQADAILTFLSESKANFNKKQEDDDDDYLVFEAGGFGGGPDQLPHAATTYSAVLALAILASSSAASTTATTTGITETADGNDNNAALQLLHEIRPWLYPWMASLHDADTGSFRMHADGEMDVRATYCVVAVAKLLHMLEDGTANSPTKSASDDRGTGSTSGNTGTTSCTLLRNTVAHIASCQTWEGGFGGEPGTEAHGGYTYCAVAALDLMNALEQNDDERDEKAAIDVPALTAWLARRQLAFEGGFSGRANKLVDGCYSFWQGSTMAIVNRYQGQNRNSTTTRSDASNVESNSMGMDAPTAANVSDTDTNSDVLDSSTALCYPCTNSEDPWLSSDAADGIETSSPPPLFNPTMLQRYILRCCQDTNGGLRDKPSKPRDYYHTCYCLSGLSIVQYYGQQNMGDHSAASFVHQTHPCYNIRMEHAAFVLDHFRRFPLHDKQKNETDQL